MPYFKTSKMVNTNYKPIKVSSKIKPLHFKDRKPVQLIEGGYYYVSFGNNSATRCLLTALPKEGENPDTISIQINGRNHSIYKDELGTTPEEAVQNQVTS